METVAEYLAALKQGAEPFTICAQAVDALFHTTTATLKFLERAVESRGSLLSVKLCAELPVSILGYHYSDQERELLKAASTGIRLRDYSRSGKLQKFARTAISGCIGAQLPLRVVTLVKSRCFGGLTDLLIWLKLLEGRIISF